MAVLIETNLGDIVIDLKVRKEGTKGRQETKLFRSHWGGPSLWLGKRKTRKFGGSGIRVEGKTRCAFG